MLKRVLLAGAVVATMATVSLAQDQPSDQSQGQQDQTQGQQDQSQQGQAEAQNPTQRYLSMQASANLLETQLGQLVAQKATDPQIKQLAQTTSQDHQQANQQLQQVAQQIGETVPQKMNQVDQAIFNQLSQLPPDQLQRQYAFYQVASHQANLLANQYEANNAQNPQIKQFAQQMTSKLQQHLQMAQQVAQAQISGIGGQAQPAGGQMTPSGGQQQQQDMSGQQK